MQKIHSRAHTSTQKPPSPSLYFPLLSVPSCAHGSDVVVGQGGVGDATNWRRAGVEREKPAKDWTFKDRKRDEAVLYVFGAPVRHRCQKHKRTSPKDLPQQGQLRFAGVWRVVRQLWGGGGGGWRGRRGPVFNHQPVSHLLDGSLVCDYGDQLREDKPQTGTRDFFHFVSLRSFNVTGRKQTHISGSSY